MLLSGTAKQFSNKSANRSHHEMQAKALKTLLDAMTDRCCIKDQMSHHKHPIVNLLTIKCFTVLSVVFI